MKKRNIKITNFKLGDKKKSINKYVLFSFIVSNRFNFFINIARGAISERVFFMPPIILSLLFMPINLQAFDIEA